MIYETTKIQNIISKFDVDSFMKLEGVSHHEMAIITTPKQVYDFHVMGAKTYQFEYDEKRVYRNFINELRATIRKFDRIMENKNKSFSGSFDDGFELLHELQSRKANVIPTSLERIEELAGEPIIWQHIDWNIVVTYRSCCIAGLGSNVKITGVTPSGQTAEYIYYQPPSNQGGDRRYRLNNEKVQSLR